MGGENGGMKFKLKHVPKFQPETDNLALGLYLCCRYANIHGKSVVISPYNDIYVRVAYALGLDETWEPPVTNRTKRIEITVDGEDDYFFISKASFDIGAIYVDYRDANPAIDLRIEP